MSAKVKKDGQPKQSGGARKGAGAPTKYTSTTPARWKELYAEHLTITHTCRAMGISAQTYHTWFGLYPEFKQATEEARMEVDDELESRLLKKVRSGETAAAIFVAKTRLRYRGYAERQELTGADGKPLVPTITFGGELPADEQAKI